ncbi:MAG TPA: DUF559 domain-containing protein [Actinomycetota bacterium]|nr:DUF559 domain-containing protein [Actinomycetota bacterium]
MVVAHRRVVEPSQITKINGIRVTGIHRTLIDLGDVVPDDVVEDALDRALERKLTSTDWLLKQIESLGTRGRKGAGVLHSIIESGHERSSWLERRFLRLLDRHSLGGFIREFAVGPYFIDFAWPEVLLGVEVHGAKWHRNRKRWTRDLSRHNDLTTQGWTVLHFTWRDVRERPDAVVKEIRTTHARLSLRLDLNAR